MENHLQLWQLQSDAENISDQNCGVQTLEPRALKTDLLLLLNKNLMFNIHTFVFLITSGNFPYH